MNGRTLPELLRHFGSPLYVYQLDEVDAAAAELRRALPEPSTLYYSLKANPHPTVARALRLLGCRAEISSTGELATALEAGFAASGCLYTGPAKNPAEIAVALSAGTRQFSVESARDYARVAAAAAEQGVVADCLVRVNARRSEGGSGLRMSGTASQFGIDTDQLVGEPEAFAQLPGGRIKGLHFFALSNARDLDSLAAEMVGNIREAAAVRDATGVDLRLLDLGGGFAAPYARAGRRPDYGKLRELLEPALDESFPGWRDGAPELAFESGRYLTGTCGQLVSSVRDVKRSRDRDFVVLDGGINHLGGLSGLGRLLPVGASVVPIDEKPVPERSTEVGRATLVGPLCSPADVLARDAELGRVNVGDVVGIPNVGAYGLTASLLAFLSRPAAAELVLRGGDLVDASRLVVHRSSLPHGSGSEEQGRGSAPW
jgi:diaminopimelate decarboxylase